MLLIIETGAGLLRRPTWMLILEVAWGPPTFFSLQPQGRSLRKTVGKWALGPGNGLARNEPHGFVKVCCSDSEQDRHINLLHINFFCRLPTPGLSQGCNGQIVGQPRQRECRQNVWEMSKNVRNMSHKLSGGGWSHNFRTIFGQFSDNFWTIFAYLVDVFVWWACPMLARTIPGTNRVCPWDKGFQCVK